MLLKWLAQDLHEILAEKPEGSELARLRATNDEQLRKYYAQISEAFRYVHNFLCLSSDFVCTEPRSLQTRGTC